jgi:FAD/FMN-containing dehydrogenase
MCTCCCDRAYVNATAAAVAGITLTELLRYATSHNLTVPLGVMPQYGDLTLGGTLATGAHGLGGRGNANVVSLSNMFGLVTVAEA